MSIKHGCSWGYCVVTVGCGGLTKPDSCLTNATMCAISENGDYQDATLIHDGCNQNEDDETGKNGEHIAWGGKNRWKSLVWMSDIEKKENGMVREKRC